MIKSDNSTSFQGPKSMSLETLQKIVDAEIKLTPMMDQYYHIKKQHPETMLLFRMGDFYEVFFEDAIEAAKILNIARTHRGKLGDFPIPMAGIPHHAASTYIDRLTQAGLKVAICEQVQDPKEAKGIVQRAVTQIVSPGMPFDLEKTQSSDNHFMASASYSNDHYYLIVIDFTTGHFLGHRFKDFDEFLDQLLQYSPKEFIAYMGQWDDDKNPRHTQLKNGLEVLGTLKTHLSAEYFDPKFSAVYLEQIIPSYKRDKVLNMHKEVLSPTGALCYYICSTQKSESYLQIRPFQFIGRDGHLKVTLHTLRGLEIFPKSRDSYKDSLLGFMDKTQTAMGSRKLKEVLSKPLTDLKLIHARQDAVEDFLKKTDLLENTREELSEIRDLERILTKISTAKANAGDLLNIAHAINVFEQLYCEIPKRVLSVSTPPGKKQRETLVELAKTIQVTINDEIGASLEKGNLIRPKASKKRDQLARIAYSANEELEKLEIRYREETGIQKLRVKSNNLAGYFIEVSKTHSDKVPASFQRRQTLVNSERYTTEELNEFEKEMITAKEKLEKLEREIFKGIISEVASNAEAIQALATSLSTIDLIHSFAWAARQEDFQRPELYDFKKEKELQLKGLWHPLIKANIRDQFVTHDLNLTSEKFFGLITGPNMAGKTTVMREVAIAQLLAQTGSFIPATEARMSLCDYLFSRLGASDDILKGQSTFMVEMSETAEIVRHATDRSLIILDEVGRGTSTYDGLSIAWALVEHLIDKTRAFTLFATHYHELIDLIDQRSEAKNLTVETQNDGDDVHFLYRLIEAPASQSFGIYVAKLAGLPENILGRASELLHSLEKSGQSPVTSDSTQPQESNGQLSFFHMPAEQILQTKIEKPKHLEKLERDLKELDLMKMTPIEALNKLHDFQKHLQ